MAKKTTKKTPRRGKRAGTPVLSFKERLSLISQAVQELPVSGVSKDGNYWYDRASEVFPIFNKLFAKFRMLPPRLIRQERKIVEFGTYPAYELTCEYIIEDIDSNESIKIMASGNCFNRDWSLDAAHTWTMKRALKDFFLAACPQPAGERTSDETFDLPYGIAMMQKDARDVLDEAREFFGGKPQPEPQPETQEPDKATKPEPEPEPIPVINEEPIEGMTKPGKNQEARIKVILDHFAKIFEIAKVDFQEQSVKNAVWLYCGKRWPKDDTEVEEIKLNLSV